jgi:hypothetical protein
MYRNVTNGTGTWRIVRKRNKDVYHHLSKVLFYMNNRQIWKGYRKRMSKPQIWTDLYRYWPDWAGLAIISLLKQRNATKRNGFVTIRTDLDRLRRVWCYICFVARNDMKRSGTERNVVWYSLIWTDLLSVWIVILIKMLANTIELGCSYRIAFEG